MSLDQSDVREGVAPPLTPVVLANHLIDWPNWCHRKVESLQLLEGERARRRVSVDCTPSPDLVVGKQAYVPLTWIAKGPMRSFDITDGSGAAVAVLGAAENGALCRSLVERIITAYRGQRGTPLAQADLRDLDVLVFGAPDEAEAARERLFDGIALDGFLLYFVTAVCNNFLLVAVLDSSAAGQRQVLKYSYHWELGPAPADPVVSFRSWCKWLKDSTLAGLGLTDAGLNVAIASPETAASFHLEVPCPPGLLSTSLELVGGEGGSPVDDRLTAVAHAHATFDRSSEPAAQVSVTLSPGSTHRTVTLAALSTAVLFLAALLLPGALGALKEAADGTASLLLFGPALLVATLARTGENVITSRLYAPLRVVALGLAGLLFLAGASLVGRLQEPWLTTLWWSAGVLSVVTASLLLLARVRMSRLIQRSTH